MPLPKVGVIFGNGPLVDRGLPSFVKDNGSAAKSTGVKRYRYSPGSLPLAFSLYVAELETTTQDTRRVLRALSATPLDMDGDAGRQRAA